MTITEPARGFKPVEFEQRLERAQRLMAKAGIAAILLTTEPDVRYFSGFLTQFWLSPTRPWFLILPLSGKPIAVIPEIGAPLMRTTWVNDIRTWMSPTPSDEGISLLVDTLRSVGADKGQIGLPMGPETMLRMPLKDYERLRAELPDVAFVDAYDIIRSLRMIKSEAEISKIAHICRIASAAFGDMPHLVSEGQPLTAAFRAFKVNLLEHGADDVPYLVGGAALGGYDNIISPPGNQALRKGDVLIMDTGALHDGYYCDFDRNYAIGKADDAAHRAYETLYRATDAGFAAARPGATCADVFRAMQSMIVADGYECGNVGRLGHGLGMQLTEWPSNTETDYTVLKPGMVLTLEPGLGIGPGRSMVHEENIVIREHGAEFLSVRAAQELPEIN
ncbi:MAG: aminopeptidase P family protein [Candidimonas sp.]|nr:MAG: aminopeptidase P family protein [Candidimonas sp.]TAM25391.1 MAG: aminopeptidase P family protein [Candidimonas sp.]